MGICRYPNDVTLTRSLYLRFTSFWHVVYFDQISSVAGTQKLVELLFFSRFQAFLFILNLFLWFQGWNPQKTSENEQKSDICLLLKAGQHTKAGKLPEGVPWIHLFWLIFYFFQLFLSVFNWFHSKKLKIVEEDLNWWVIIFVLFLLLKKLKFDYWFPKITYSLEKGWKSSSTSFRLHTTHESWSKYTILAVWESLD